jgi:ABC-type multidrug transport system fused ATPase/permease subunit
MSQVSGKAFDGKLFGRVLTYTRPYRGIFGLAIALTVMLSFLSVVRPMLIRHVVNTFIQVPVGADQALSLKSSLLLRKT